jgi:ankyrin repeat protein/uncharacterized protein YegL
MTDIDIIHTNHFNDESSLDTKTNDSDSDEPVEVPQHFKCPISQCIMLDPITVPCCCRSYSRQSLEVMFQTRKICPMCHVELKDYDPSTAPRAVTLQNIIDAFVKEHDGNLDDLILDKIDIEKPRLRCILRKVCQKGPNLTQIAQLKVINMNKEFKSKSLLFVVVDESGSMSGSPINQVRFSLKRIVDSAYDNSSILCQVVGYDNTAQSFFIDISQTKETNYSRVEKIGRGGGTNFKCAFEEIIRIMNDMKASPVNNLNEISNLIIVFMTDGEDSYSTGIVRMNLANKLGSDIRSVWDKQYVVHTIGFGANHDFNFLEHLAKTGTITNDSSNNGINGVYRYANPNEDNDSLSTKINSIIQVVMNESVGQIPPFSIEPINLNANKAPQIIGQSNGSYWIDVTKFKDEELVKSKYLVKMKGYPDLTLRPHLYMGNNQSLFEQSEVTDNQLEYTWYSYLIDRIADELVDLNKESNNQLDRQLHLELLNLRIKALNNRLSSDSQEFLRLTEFASTLANLRKGETVDQKQLADQCAEGLFKTTGKKIVSTQYNPSNYANQSTNVTIHVDQSLYSPLSWKTIDTSKVRPIVRKGIESNHVIQIFTNSKNDDCRVWLDSNDKTTILSIKDAEGSNLLTMMSGIGRATIVRMLLDLNIFDRNAENDVGYTALDKAIMFGHWKTYDVLRLYDVKKINLVQKYDYFRTCVSKKGYTTAKRLVRDYSVVIDDHIINTSPPESTQWLIANSDTDIDMTGAVIKGLYDIVEEKIQKGYKEKLSWETFDQAVRVNKLTLNHVQIFDLLLEHKLLDPDETYTIKNPTLDRKEDEDDTEITWPLFIACEKGDVNLFTQIMRYCSKELSVDRQNKKGCYCLWIAACNKHVDIVTQLLSRGADPNMVNIKGENSIVPACQKSAVRVVEVLLIAHARLDLYDKKRDNPFLLCCRTGQSVILEMFLQRLNPDELKEIHNQIADIDGFNPLLASTELNKLECIKVCHTYHADLEWKTAPTNQILPGSTALHLACFYDRLESLKLLIELGADLRATTSVGQYNCMHIAVRRGHGRIIGYLMNYNVDLRDYLLAQKDESGQSPAYYAQISGNEEIYKEYFCNNLVMYLEKLMYTPDENLVKSCTDKLIRYGQSPGIYEYDSITKLDMGKGMSIGSMAVINRSETLLKSLIKMGLDVTQTDDYGISTEFWSAFIGSNNNDRLSQKTIDMLNNLEDAKQQSMQSKVLLSPPTKAPLLMDSQTNRLIATNANQSNITLMLKMNDGYGQTVDDSVLKILKRSVRGEQKQEQPLLGFVDKLSASNKSFPDGKDCLNYIVWESKLHAIKLIASGEQYLNPTQILALHLYSINKTIFEQFNIGLTKWNLPANSIWQPFILTIYQALNQLPEFAGEVYRAVDNYKFDPGFYAIGTTITWSTLSICSKEYSQCIDLIKRDQGIVFIVKSKTGRDIGRYSNTPADQDVMFLPGSKFAIINYYQSNEIAMSQANIRNVTFKIREKDIQNAVNGKCIIIELRELDD